MMMMVRAMGRRRCTCSRSRSIFSPASSSPPSLLQQQQQQQKAATMAFFFSNNNNNNNSKMVIRSAVASPQQRRLFSSALGHLRSVTEDDVRALRDIVPDDDSNNNNDSDDHHPRHRSHVSTVGADHPEFRRDWTGHYACGDNVVVVEPGDAPQVARVLQYCSRHRIGVVPVAGHTGLVGGSVPYSGDGGDDDSQGNNSSSDNGSNNQILLSLRRLDRIESLSPVSGILKAQAGTVLQTLQEYAADRDWRVPLDLGSRGSCCVGGNVATAAGGSHYCRYGSLAGNLVGLQVATVNGELLDLNYTAPTVLKHNAGYKLHQLLVGSEGTLAVITGVALQCAPLLPIRQTAWLDCGGSQFDDSVLRTLQLARRSLGEILAAAEWMDAAAVELVARTHAGPIPLWRKNGGNGGGDSNTATTTTTTTTDNNNNDSQHYLLLETHGSNADHDAAKLERFFEEALAAGCAVDGVLARDVRQQQSLWKVREAANPAAAQTGYTYKYDVSLPDSQFGGFVAEMRERLGMSDDGAPGGGSLAPNLHNPNWGHVLDGNLHFNVVAAGERAANPAVLERLEPHVYEAVVRRGGSISAEHGIGQAKVQCMPLVHGAATLRAMRRIKRAWDPAGILNPGKVLPPQSPSE